MVFICLRIFGVLILLLGIFQGLCYSLGVEIATSIICGLVLFDVFIGSVIDNLKR